MNIKKAKQDQCLLNALQRFIDMECSKKCEFEQSKSRISTNLEERILNMLNHEDNTSINQSTKTDKTIVSS